jgi:NAD(P)H-dependent flavin oxidoreductase YrpB (nitropropane dioxygenase family)
MWVRKNSFTNLSFYSYDYTKGKLMDLVDIVIESKAALFVSAVGVPPKAVVDKLHAAGILYMNMIGHPKHVKKCLELGVDLRSGW